MALLDEKRLGKLLALLLLVLNPVATMAQPPSVDQAKRLPVALDLTSTVPTSWTGSPAKAGTVTIQVGGNLMQVSKGTLLTPAERMAVYQVISSGRQFIKLGPNGDAIGGSFIMSPRFSQFVNNLVVPAGVTAIANFGSSSQLNFSGNLINSGNIYSCSSSVSGNTATFGAINIINRGIISNSLPAAQIPGFVGSNSQLNLVLKAGNNLFNYGSITSSGNLSLLAGNQVVNQTVTNTAVISSHGNLILSAPAMTNQGIIVSRNGDISVLTNQLTNSAQMQSLQGSIQVQNLTGNTLVVDNLGGSILANQKISIESRTLTRDVTGLLPPQLDVKGGDFSAANVDFSALSGSMNVLADNIGGNVSLTGGSTSIGVAGGSLKITNLALTGASVIWNTGGDLDLCPLSSSNGGTPYTIGGNDFVALASGNILCSSAGTIDASSSSGAGGQIVIEAGVNLNANILSQCANASLDNQKGVHGAYSSGSSPTGGSVNLGSIKLVTNANDVKIEAHNGCKAGADLGSITIGSVMTSGTMDGQPGGNITINAGFIGNSAGSTSTGSIYAGSLTANGNSANQVIPGDISSSGFGNGAAGGNVMLTAGGKGSISISAITSNGGSGAAIDTYSGIACTHTVDQMHYNLNTNFGNGGNGGTITLNAGGAILWTDSLSSIGGNGNGTNASAADIDSNYGNGGNGGAITLSAGTISSVGTISSTGGSGTGLNLRKTDRDVIQIYNRSDSNYGNGGDAGDISLTVISGIFATGAINSTGGSGNGTSNATGGSFAYGNGGNGGKVTLAANTINSVGAINSVGGNGNGMDLTGSRTNWISGSDSSYGNGGNSGSVTLLAGSEISLVNSVGSKAGAGSAINGNLSDNSEFDFGNGGNSGTIVLKSGGAISSSGSIGSYGGSGAALVDRASSEPQAKVSKTGASHFGNGGSSGALTLMAGGSISTGTISSAGGRGLGADATGGGASCYGSGGNGAPITIIAGGSIASSAISSSGGPSISSGLVIMTAWTALPVPTLSLVNPGAAASGDFHCGNGGDAGQVTLIANGGICLAGDISTAGGSSGGLAGTSGDNGYVGMSGNGQACEVVSLQGNISLGSIQTMGYTSGGSVALEAAGTISAADIKTYASGLTGIAGDIFVSSGASSRGAVSLGIIDTSAAIAGTAGAVFLGANVAHSLLIEAPGSTSNFIKFSTANSEAISTLSPFLFGREPQQPVSSTQLTITVSHAQNKYQANIFPGVYPSIGSPSSPVTITLDCGGDNHLLVPIASSGSIYLSSLAASKASDYNASVVAAGGIYFSEKYLSNPQTGVVFASPTGLLSLPYGSGSGCVDLAGGKINVGSSSNSPALNVYTLGALSLSSKNSISTSGTIFLGPGAMMLTGSSITLNGYTSANGGITLIATGSNCNSITLNGDLSANSGLALVATNSSLSLQSFLDSGPVPYFVALSSGNITTASGGIIKASSNSSGGGQIVIESGIKIDENYLSSHPLSGNSNYRRYWSGSGLGGGNIDLGSVSLVTDGNVTIEGHSGSANPGFVKIGDVTTSSQSTGKTAGNLIINAGLAGSDSIDNTAFICTGALTADGFGRLGAGGTISLMAPAAIFTGSISSTVGSENGNGGSGGTIRLISTAGGITTGPVSANGGQGGGDLGNGGVGGTITLTAPAGNITTDAISSNGGNSGKTGNGGSGGAITFKASGSIFTGSINCNGGNGISSGSIKNRADQLGNGGNGGKISLIAGDSKSNSSSDSFNICTGDISSVGGNGTGTSTRISRNSSFGNGGNGGEIRLISLSGGISTGAINLYGGNGQAGEDGTGNAHIFRVKSDIVCGNGGNGGRLLAEARGNIRSSDISASGGNGCLMESDTSIHGEKRYGRYGNNGIDGAISFGESSNQTGTFNVSGGAGSALDYGTYDGNSSFGNGGNGGLISLMPFQTNVISDNGDADKETKSSLFRIAGEPDMIHSGAGDRTRVTSFNTREPGNAIVNSDLHQRSNFDASYVASTSSSRIPQLRTQLDATAFHLQPSTALAALLSAPLRPGKNTSNEDSSLNHNSFLLAPSKMISIQTHDARISIAAGSVIFVTRTDSAVAICDLLDTHRGAVSVTSNGRRIELLPGRQVVLARKTGIEFDRINPTEDISYRNLHACDIGGGVMSYISEISIISALRNVKMLHDLFNSHEFSERRIAERLLRNAAILSIVSNRSTPFTSSKVAQR